MTFGKNSKKRHNRTPKKARLSLIISIFYGTLLACVPVAVVHTSSKSKLPHGHYTTIIIAYSCKKVKVFSIKSLFFTIFLPFVDIFSLL